MGDLHVENFGTWRDAEGRLVWGVNDFDEAWPLPCTFDLVRLAASRSCSPSAISACAAWPLPGSTIRANSGGSWTNCPPAGARSGLPHRTPRGRFSISTCSRIELSDLPRERDESRLLYAMGWETANIHLGSLKAKAALQALKSQPRRWFEDAAGRMVDAVTADWREWCKRGP